jgi:Ca-activated chloride channel homolog
MALLRLLTFSLILLFTATFAHAEGQRVILVLDASGSMWGQISGKAKIDIAKDVVSKVIGNWKPEDELGLVAYGHRKKGACDDIETLIEPGSLNSSSFISTVKGLSPKGKTPMTQAVRQAAEALKFTEKQATVILVSDGIETCDPNPCAVAEELEKMGIGLTVHTVGFGLDDQGAVSQLKCLAEKTGGIAVLAEDAKELETALKTTVEAKVEEPPPAPAPEPAAPEFNFKGRIVMAENVETLPAGFDQPAWEIFKSINGEKGEWVLTQYGANVKAKVEQDGDYLVIVSADQARVSTPISFVGGKPVELDLSFEAGLITFRGMNDDTSPMTDPATVWELTDKNGQWLATKYGPEASFFASAGDYRMRLTLGEAKVETDVAFTAGKAEKRDVVLAGGVIAVSAFFTQGGEPLLDGAAIELREGTPGLDGKNKWIGTQYGPKVNFKVPPGKYQIFAQQDHATGITEVEVGASKTANVTIAINAGVLAATSRADAVMEVYAGEKDLAGKRKWIATDYNGQFNKALNAGSFYVVAKAPDGSVIGERDVMIEAGKRLEITIP